MSEYIFFSYDIYNVTEIENLIYNALLSTYICTHTNIVRT